MTPDDYQQAIHELAHMATMPDEAATRMEAALGQAFESSRAGSEETTAGSNQPPLKLRRSAGALAKAEHPALQRVSIGALAAAAAVVIAAGGGAWYLWRPPVTSNSVTRTPSPATGKADLKVAAIETAALKASTTDAASTSEVRVRRPRKLPPVIHPQGFVPVPAAAGLPEFESGVIVRMSLPAAALPTYGVDISPASSDEPIEADVLVGQDGRARAIRLVNTSRSQQ